MFRTTLYLLLGAVGLKLLISCAEYGKSAAGESDTSRTREMLDSKAAVGAGRGRIIRQLLTETVVLALAAER